ncbi:hypothetical protein ACV1DG_23990 [Aeromonas hydrophila]
MKVWAFDENRADFVDAAPERMNADATGYYIIRRGDDVLVREHGQERPMPERLTVAGVPKISLISKHKTRLSRLLLTVKLS